MKKYIILITAIAFSYFFSNDGAGINLLIYTSIVLGGLYSTTPVKEQSRTLTILSTLCIITSFAVFWHDSYNALLAYIICLIATIGCAKSPLLKSIHISFVNALLKWVSTIEYFVNERKALQKTKFPYLNWNYIKLSIIPLLIVCLFFLIYKGANATFDEYVSSFFDYISNHLHFISYKQVLFIIPGLIIGLIFHYGRGLASITQWQLGSNTSLIRIRRDSKIRKFNKLGLRNENRSALLMLICVNLLLALVNSIDIVHVWFSYESNNWSAARHASTVHEGTYLLIFSILLSIGLLLYFFRANQNFYSKGKRIRVLALIWIVQNGILLISVALKNWHYVQNYQLAHNRVGVFIFLSATLFGLISLLIKIRYKKSFYFMAMSNSWCWMALLVAMSMVNWDNLIVRYNLTHSKPADLDIHFVLSCSDKTLGVLAEEYEKLSEAINSQPQQSDWHHSENNYLTLFHYRLKEFKKRKSEESWKSFSLAEQQALNNINKLNNSFSYENE